MTSSMVQKSFVQMGGVKAFLNTDGETLAELGKLLIIQEIGMDKLLLPAKLDFCLLFKINFHRNTVTNL